MNDLTDDLYYFRAGVVAFNDQQRLLIIRRGRRPAAGLWTLPMGKLKKGENFEDGAQRETLEETGFEVSTDSLLGVFSSNGIELRVYIGKILGGNIQPGDDADEVRFVSFDEFISLDNKRIIPEDDWAYDMNEEIFEKLLPVFLQRSKQ